MNSENATFNMAPTKQDDSALLDPPKPPAEHEESLNPPKPPTGRKDQDKPKSIPYRVGRRLGKLIGGLVVLFLSVTALEVMALVVVWLFKVLTGLL